MSASIGMVMFFIVFLLIYGFMNFVVLFSFTKFFGLSTNWIFFVLLIFLTTSFLLSTTLISKFDNLLTKSYYVFSSLWMGFSFIIFCLLVLYHLINLVYPMNHQYIGWIILGIALILSMISIYNTSVINVRTITIESDKIDRQLRIVHLTDLHLGPIYGQSHTNKVVYMTNLMSPDLVLITGDLIDGKYFFEPGTFKEFYKLKSEVYLTLGNHERYPGTDLIQQLISGTKIKLLRNEQIQTSGINIIGIDDSDDKSYLSKTLKEMSGEIDSSKFNLIMYHRPTGFKEAAQYADFMLAGHTHAGQIWPFTYLAKWANDGAVKGIYSVGEKPFLYVGSGTGTWGPKMRLGSQNEITLILLKPKKT